MTECIHKINIIELNDTYFDSICDCTYIMLCCGDNPYREQRVIRELSKLKPTKTVKLFYFNGFKKCGRRSPTEDAFHSQRLIFEDAIKNGFKRILFLEDDFEVHEISADDVKSIVAFMNDKNPDVYGLGNACIPSIGTLFKHHQRSLFNHLGMAHCVFYNQNYMRNFLDYYDKHKYVLMHDLIVAKIPNIIAYRYYKPLVCQTFPQTKNQLLSWREQMGVCGGIAIIGVRLTGLHKSFEPGYTIIYMIPYVLYSIVLIMLILVMVGLIWKIYTNQNKIQ